MGRELGAAPGWARQLFELAMGWAWSNFAALERAAHDEEGYLTTLPARPQDRLYLFAADVVGAGQPRGLYRYDSSTGTYTSIA